MNIKDSSENPFFVSRRILKVTTNVQSFRGKSKLFGPLELVSCIRQADGRGTSVIIRYLSGEKSSISTKEERSASLDERTCLVDELLISSFLFFFFFQKMSLCFVQLSISCIRALPATPQ